ncbi:MAG: sulfatase [Candidatus Ranarchaeia archaeon]
MSNPPNIIIFAIDTLRADHLGCYGYHRDTSPNIDRFASKSILLENAYSASSWTTPAFTSLFTSQLPSRHKAVLYPKPKIPQKGTPTLAGTLKENGYQTGGFHGGGFVSDDFGLGRGFDSYESSGKNFEDNWEKCTSWIKQCQAQPIFLFFHGFNCHRPYLPPKEFDIYFTEYTGNYDASQLYMPNSHLPLHNEDIKHIIAKYDGCIQYTDYLFGKFQNWLKENHLWDNSIIIVLSDHGEEFLEHGAFDHIRTLYEEVIRIPLIIHYAPLKSKRLTSPVSITDLFPTIIDLLNIAPSTETDGKSFLDLISSREDDQQGSPIFFETGYQRKYLKQTETTNLKPNRPDLLRGVLDNNWKLLLDSENSPIELYNLAKDPHEKDNLIHHKDISESAKLFAKFIDKDIYRNIHYDNLETAGIIDDYKQTIRERLKRLGYF